LYYSLIISGSGRDGNGIIPAINEVYIKEETIDDVVASTSQDQHLVIKREESINIKQEPLTSDVENSSLDTVSFHAGKIFLK
jgi:hypothetical protein